MASMIEYYQALERLKKGKPDRIEKPYAINKDTVALEAGRKRGSIKRSRASFALLIEEIRKANTECQQSASLTPVQQLRDSLDKAKGQSVKWRELYEQSLGRELSLIAQVRKLQLELSQCRKARVDRQTSS